MITNINKLVVLGGGTAGLISALMFREKFPHTNITVVKSSNIGIVGVGEGSTEHWATFMQFIGISINELIKETKGTVKIGILFKDWLRKDHEYVHSVSGLNLLSGLSRLDAYHNLLLENQNYPYPLSPLFHFFRNNQVVVFNNLSVSHQYHFDTFALNQYLTKHCELRSINFLDNDVDNVELDFAGNVSRLNFVDKSKIEGDFFIDCSGFKRVISNALKTNWISYEKYLPMNRAIAFPTTFKKNQNYEPYTTATALSAGWSWKIPTQERYGNGYVFNNNYISADEALHEISKSLGKKIEKVGRDIPFTAGRLDNFWVKNCVSIGLSGSFAEPLEAQSIGFTILQASGLIDMLEGWSIDSEYVSKEYNRLFTLSFDNIVSYLQAHYFVERNDTQFWKDKPFELTEFNLQTKKIFSKGMFVPTYFPDKYIMFHPVNFYQVYAGLNLVDKEHVTKIQNSNRDSFIQSIRSQAAQNKQQNAQMVLNHNDYINLIKALK